MSAAYVQLMRRIASHKGFTLIELLITVVILAILAAVVYSLMQAPKDRTKASRAIAAAQDAFAQAQVQMGRDGNYQNFSNSDLTGQVSKSALDGGLKPGEGDTSSDDYNRVYMTVSSSGELINICSNAPKVAAYCIRHDSNKTVYRRVDAGTDITLAAITTSPDSDWEDKWVE